MLSSAINAACFGAPAARTAEIKQCHISRKNELPHDKTNKMACAPSEDSDQSGHPPSLISLCCLHEESLGP